MRALILFLLLACQIFAFDLSSLSSAYKTDYPIYIYGDVGYIEDTFNAIAMIVGSTEAKVVLATGITWLAMTTGWQTAKAQGLGPAISNGTAAIIASTLLLVPNVTVHIIDNRADKGTVIGSTNTYAKVDNIPYFIAMTASVSTSLSSSLVDLSSSAFATIDPSLDKLTYSKLGLNGAYTVATDILKNTKLSRKTAMYVDDYTRLCVMQNIANNNANDVFPVLVDNLKNPNGDWFTVNSPTNLGISSLTFDAPDGSGITTCGDYYNIYVLPAVTDEKKTQLNALQAKYPTLDLNNTKDAFQVSLGMGQNFQNTVVNPLADLETFMVNYGASQAVMQTISTYGSNVNGINLSNAINVDTAKARLKMEGLGQWSWASTMIPNIMHFMTGVIYSSSIFMLMLIVWVGYDVGKSWLKNYALGILMFESIRLALQITNDLVNHYAAKEAVTKLANIGNVASIDGSLDYFDYISDMTGTAGQLGLAAVMVIPSIIFGGKVMNAMSSVGALQGLMNSMVQTAQAEAIRQRTQDTLKDKYGQSAQQLAADAAYMGEIDSYTSNLSKRHVMDSGNANNYVAGSLNNADMRMGQVAGAGQVDGNYMGAGTGMGRQSSLQSLGAGEAANRSLSSSSDMAEFRTGAMNQAGKSIGSTIGAGRSEQSYDSIASGAANSSQLSTEAEAVSGGVKGDLLADALRKSNYMKGTARNTKKELTTTEGVGSAQEPTNEQWDNTRTAAAIGFESSMLSNSAKSKTFGNATGNGLNEDAKDSIFASSVDGSRKAIASGKKLNDAFGGDILNGKDSRGMSDEQVNTAEATKEVSARLGSAAAIQNVISRHPGAYGSIAEFTENKSVNGQLADMKAFEKNFGEGNKGFDSYEKTAQANAEESYQGQKGQAEGFRANQNVLGGGFKEMLARTSALAAAQSQMTSIKTAKGEDGYVDMQKQSARLSTISQMANNAAMAGKSNQALLAMQTTNALENLGQAEANADLLSSVQGQDAILKNLRANGATDESLKASGMLNSDGMLNRSKFAEAAGKLQAGAKTFNVMNDKGTLTAVTSHFQNGNSRTAKADANTQHPGALMDNISHALGLSNEHKESLKGMADEIGQAALAIGVGGFVGYKTWQAFKGGKAAASKIGEAIGGKAENELGASIAKGKAIGKNVAAKNAVESTVDNAEKIESLKAMKAAAFTKNEIKTMIDERKSALSADLQAGKITQEQFLKTDSTLSNLNTKLNAGKNITSGELFGAGINSQQLAEHGISFKNIGGKKEAIDFRGTGERLRELEIAKLSGNLSADTYSPGKVLKTQLDEVKREREFLLPKRDENPAAYAEANRKFANLQAVARGGVDFKSLDEWGEKALNTAERHKVADFISLSKENAEALAGKGILSKVDEGKFVFANADAHRYLHENHKLPTSEMSFGMKETISATSSIAKTEAEIITKEAVANSGALSKVGAYFGRHIPGAGNAIGGAMAAEQAATGNYVGAAMTSASTAVSNVAGWGTLASFAIDGASAIMSATGIEGRLNSMMAHSNTSSAAAHAIMSQPTHIPTHVVQQGPITQQASLRTMEDMSMQIQRGNNFAVQQTHMANENKQVNAEMLSTLKAMLKKDDDIK